ncbi:hypothetical protein Hdeb2414_s0006g00222021 [Helianthus debilis subsp. tardiflorus]
MSYDFIVIHMLLTQVMLTKYSIFLAYSILCLHTSCFDLYRGPLPVRSAFPVFNQVSLSVADLQNYYRGNMS